MKRFRFPTKLILCVLVLIFAFSGLAAGKANKTTTPKVVSLEKAAVGDIVVFGSYEQDNNRNNGKEAVEWIVLDVRKDRALLLSKYGLDAQPFHKENAEVTWETCSLRKWLNKDFFASCFTEEEQTSIISTTVDASGNWKYPKVDAGNKTKDKVFLLSMEEASGCSYFENPQYENSKYQQELQNDRRLCQATSYAKKQGAYIGKDGTSYWWLRTPGPNQMHAAYINTDGSIFGGGMVFHKDGAVRPAIWVAKQPGTSVQTAQPNTDGHEKSASVSTDNAYFGLYDTDSGWSEDEWRNTEDQEELFEEFLDTWYIEGDDIQESFEEFLDWNDMDPDQIEDYEEFLDEYIIANEELFGLDEYDLYIDEGYDPLYDDYPNDYPDDPYDYPEELFREDFPEEYSWSASSWDDYSWSDSSWDDYSWDY